MWQLFSPNARRVVFNAQKEAERLGYGYVSTEHLLLGILETREGMAWRVLLALNIRLEDLKTVTESMVPKSVPVPGSKMTLTPRAKRVIDLAYKEAQNLGDSYIGTEHLLLGLLREGDGLAGRLLAKHGVQLVQTRRTVIAVQEKPPVETTGPKARLLEAFRRRGRRLSRAASWARLSDRAKMALYVADAEARTAGSPCVTTEHILLGLIREPATFATAILKKLGVDPEEVRSELLKQVRTDKPFYGRVTELSPNGKTAIDRAFEEARELNSNYVGTGHLLLGLMATVDESAAETLTMKGATDEAVRGEIEATNDSQTEESASRSTPDIREARWLQYFKRKKPS